MLKNKVSEIEKQYLQKFILLNGKIDPFERKISKNADGEEVLELKKEFTVTVSNEADIEDYGDWIRVLEHSEEAVDLTYYKNDGAVLIDHVSKDHVGVINDGWIENKSLRASIRLTDVTELGRETILKVNDRILVHFSVGGIPIEQEVTEKDGVRHIRVTRWLAIEASLTPIPKDINTGIDGINKILKNFGIHTEEKPMTQEKEKEKEVEKTIINPDPEAGLSEIQKRMLADPAFAELVEKQSRAAARSIITEDNKVKKARHDERVEFLKKTSLVRAEQDRLLDYADKDDWDIGKFANETLSRIKELTDNGEVEKALDGQLLGLENKQRKNISMKNIAAIVTGLADDSDYKEDCTFEKELRAESNKNRTGNIGEHTFVVPIEYYIDKGFFSNINKVTSSAANSAGATFQTDLLGRALPTLRPNGKVLDTDMQIYVGLKDDIKIARRENDVTMAYLAENGKAAGNDVTYDAIDLKMFTASGASVIGRKVLMQSNIAVEENVASSINRGVELNIDNTVLNGSGEANNPKGFLKDDTVDGTNFLGGTTKYASYVSYQQWAAAFGVMSKAHLDNPFDGGLSIFIDGDHYAQLISQPKIAGSGSQGFIIDYRNGRPYIVGNPVFMINNTSALPADTSVIASMSHVALGVWNMAVLDRDTTTNRPAGSVRLDVKSDIGTVLTRTSAIQKAEKTT